VGHLETSTCATIAEEPLETGDQGLGSMRIWTAAASCPVAKRAPRRGAAIKNETRDRPLRFIERNIPRAESSIQRSTNCKQSHFRSASSIVMRSSDFRNEMMTALLFSALTRTTVIWPLSISRTTTDWEARHGPLEMIYLSTDLFAIALPD
jgi:hypothetical protein